MNLFMRSKFFSFIALLAFAGAHAEDADLEKVVGSLIAAEKAYAKLAGEKGFREASISVFADDAVIFAPHAVNGKKFWREAKKDPPLILHMNTAITRETATRPMNVESTFASGGSNHTALRKSRATFKRARRQRNRNTLLSFRA